MWHAVEGLDVAPLVLGLLGPFQVSLGGKPLEAILPSKARALLAYLALEPRRAHSRQALAELLWPDYAPAVALTNLRNTLSRLRAALGDRQQDPPFLLITRHSVRLNSASDYRADVDELREALA